MKEKKNPLTIKEMPLGDRPYEKLEKMGESALTNTELLAILLKTGIKGTSVMNLAQQLQRLDCMNEGISFLCRIPIEDLTDLPGVGRVKAILIKASVELGRRVARSNPQDGETIIHTPLDLVQFVQEEMQQLSKEEMRIALLDSKNALIRIIRIADGSVKSTLFSPREIFKDAMKYNAASMILVHNHPSGNPAPSQNDLNTTLSLSKIARELDIPILDHIIIGKTDYRSIRCVLEKENESGRSGSQGGN